MVASVSDVAIAAGVSTATASRALRGLTGVAESTRSRVLECAQALGYIYEPFAPDSPADSATIAVIAPFLNRWYFSNLITGVDQVSRSMGFDLLLYTFGDLDGRDRVLNRYIFERRPDAIVIISLQLGEHEKELLQSLAVPTILVGSKEPGFTSVLIDDYAGASLAVQHLINLGHRDVGLISGFPDDPMDFTVNRDRRRAFVDTLGAAGIEFNPQLEAYGSFAMRSGERAMDELLARPVRPTAVFVESDEMAFGAMRSINRHGLAIPDDLSIVGFDDHEMSEVLGLTTISQPVTGIGEMAAYALVDRLKSPGLEPAVINVPTRLVVRTSTRAVDG